jgi:hypothetical protein
MIAEIIPEAYDAAGKQVSQSFFQRHAPNAGVPFGRYISQPLTVKCESMRDVRRFLSKCQYVTAKKLFGKKYHWQPPEEFETLKKGACVEFSLWTWRQMLSLGYDARFVGGSHGRYGEGHACVEYFQADKCYLVEPLLRLAGEKLPRLSTLRYSPKMSVSWDGNNLKYFTHKHQEFFPSWPSVVPLAWEWLLFWGWLWIRVIVRLSFGIGRKLWRKASGKPAKP